VSTDAAHTDHAAHMFVHQPSGWVSRVEKVMPALTKFSTQPARPTSRIDERLVGSVVRLPADDRTWGPLVLVIGVSDSGGGAVRISFVRDGVASDTVLGAEVSAHGALTRSADGRDQAPAEAAARCRAG